MWWKCFWENLFIFILNKVGKMNWDDLNMEKSYSPWDAYSNSKLANCLFTVELAKRLKNTGVIAVCLHPGKLKFLSKKI